ncbi:MAG: hypothetical protein NC253_04400 [Ruminococcus sp.]|nr:hypothetical protein [Ruminococcus sp.]MCM1381039.1 hypothetical protein [Muribaculaceae bacterium]MCM1479728.1 hypothetical protein [Muribaculaceae bacterium]
MRVKKFLIVPIVIILLLCTACNKLGEVIPAKNPDLSKPFQSAVKMRAGELELEGTVKRYGAGIWEMTVNSPETLAGLTLAGSDGGVNVSLGELNLELPAENISDKAVFALLFKAIDSAASGFEAGVLTCTDTEDGRVCGGEFSGGTYTLTFDPQTLALTRLEIPEAEISAIFEPIAD